MIQKYQINFKLDEIENISTDFIVIGMGVAGLTTALDLCSIGEVMLFSKDKVEECNTEYAQGGVAAVINDKDDFKLHYEDTIYAGSGLCNPKAVEILVEEGPKRIKDLISLGANFDKKVNNFALTKEGGHRKKRVLHAGGDSTGKEIRATLFEESQKHPEIKIKDEIFIIDLIKSNGRCQGVIAYDKKKDKLLAYKSTAVIIASGGAGQLFSVSSNPQLATGDGIAMAYRAGVEVIDLEMFQFHPTVLKIDGEDNFLISEAVRGEGAILRNENGNRFMDKYHKMKELAPRDIVASAIYNEIKKQKSNHVYLDARDLDSDFLIKRFPTIYKVCYRAGIDITKELIPVAPAAHYLMGGIKTNLYGETSLDNLFACGETACLGVHGANRLASNSLLEGLVFGHRVAKRIKDDFDDLKFVNRNFSKINYQKLTNYNSKIDEKELSLKLKDEIQCLMTEYVGIVRTEKDLKYAFNKIKELMDYLNYNFQQIKILEVKNLIILAYLTVKSAIIRKESRGVHYRKDYPQKKDSWKKHIVLKKDKKWSELKIEFE